MRRKNSCRTEKHVKEHLIIAKPVVGNGDIVTKRGNPKHTKNCGLPDAGLPAVKEKEEKAIEGKWSQTSQL